MSNLAKISQSSDLAERIKSARIAARLSQNMLAKHIGVSDKSISAYEQGRSTPPIAKLKKISAVTSHPLSYFTEEDNKDAVISSKLASIEHELREIKDLLNRRNTAEEK